MQCWLDHLVVAARTLEDGAAFLAARLGCRLEPGGRHAAMGTHNRLLGIGRDRYLELIAADPAGEPPARRRWFDLDAPGMAARLAGGPALVGWVARCPDLAAACRASPAAHGDILALSRGDLAWRITVPADGSRPAGGVLPYLIEWQAGGGPAARLPDAGCTLAALHAGHPRPDEVAAALAALGLTQELAGLDPAPRAWLRACLRSPAGTVILE